MDGQTCSIRQSLAASTRAAHLELHRHEWIAALARPCINEHRYWCVLLAYREFYRYVESMRKCQAFFPDLSLEEATRALEEDTSGCQLADKDFSRYIALKLRDKPSVLGALYVLHGAGFGASILKRNIEKRLPSVTRHFLSIETSDTLWQRLSSHLDIVGREEKNIRQLEDSAIATFRNFGQFVTLLCEFQTSGNGLEYGLTAGSQRSFRY